MKDRISVPKFFSCAVSQLASLCVVSNGSLKDLQMNNSLEIAAVEIHCLKKKDSGCSAQVLTETSIWICVSSASVCGESLIVPKCWDRDIKENEKKCISHHPTSINCGCRDKDRFMSSLDLIYLDEPRGKSKLFFIIHKMFYSIEAKCISRNLENQCSWSAIIF